MALSNFQRTIVDDAGNVIPNATVTVRVNDSSGALADLFTDRAGTSPASNPISADGEGFVRFYVAGGRYYIKAEGASAEIEWEDYLIGTMQGQDSDSVAVTGGTVNATTLQQGGSQAYVRANILGTVSQSAGVPTGAVIERGSNANGEFVRFADGTQICNSVFTYTPSGASDVRSMPVNFVDSPSGALSIHSGSTATRGVIRSTFPLVQPADTFWRIYGDDASYTTAVTLTAVGRWY